MLSAGRFALTSLGSTSPGWTSHGRTNESSSPVSNPGFPRIYSLWVPSCGWDPQKVLRGLGHTGLPASEVRFCPRPWSVGLTAQRPGAEGLPSQLCYHAKAEVAVVRRIGFSRSYKPSATLKRRTFSLKHGVCSKRGCGHARVLHDMSSLQLHATHEVLLMVCCHLFRVTCGLISSRNPDLKTGPRLFATQRTLLPSYSVKDRLELCTQRLVGTGAFAVADLPAPAGQTALAGPPALAGHPTPLKILLRRRRCPLRNRDPLRGSIAFLAGAI